MKELGSPNAAEVNASTVQATIKVQLSLTIDKHELIPLHRFKKNQSPAPTKEKRKQQMIAHQRNEVVLQRQHQLQRFDS